MSKCINLVPIFIFGVMVCSLPSQALASGEGYYSPGRPVATPMQRQSETGQYEYDYRQNPRSGDTGYMFDSAPHISSGPYVFDSPHTSAGPYVFDAGRTNDPSGSFAQDNSSVSQGNPSRQADISVEMNGQTQWYGYGDICPSCEAGLPGSRYRTVLLRSLTDADVFSDFRYRGVQYGDLRPARKSYACDSGSTKAIVTDYYAQHRYAVCVPDSKDP